MFVKTRLKIISHPDANTLTKIPTDKPHPPHAQRHQHAQQQNKIQQREIFMRIYVIDHYFREIRSWYLKQHKQNTNTKRLNDIPPIRPQHLNNSEYLRQDSLSPVCLSSIKKPTDFSCQRYQKPLLSFSTQFPIKNFFQ